MPHGLSASRSMSSDQIWVTARPTIVPSRCMQIGRTSSYSRTRTGGLDETLALNLEDVEWQTRARSQGFLSRIAAQAEIFHRRPGRVRRHTGAYYQARNICILTSRLCDHAALVQIRVRLYLEGL